jgi:hypothetical protein
MNPAVITFSNMVTWALCDYDKARSQVADGGGCL